jgi:predicted ATPase
MLIASGIALNATQGYAAPEVAQTYLRARQLCARLDDPHQRFSVMRGLWVYYLLCADLQTAHALSEQLLEFAQQAQDTAMLLTAQQSLGATLYHLGAVASAYTHDAQGIALYDAQQHRTSAFLYGEDSGVICHSHAAWELWYLGSPDQGLGQSHEAVTLARQIAHPFSLGFAWGMTAMFHQFRREVRAAHECAEAAISLTTEQGFPYWMTVGAMLRGWSLAYQGQAQEGIAQITQGLLTYRATGAELLRPYFLALLAEAYSVIGQPEAGLLVLTEALALVDTTGERWCEPELYRLQGALLLQQHLDNQPEAERCFQRAIMIAQDQQAKSLELRATTSLARLWQQQGKRREAYDLLAPVYHWFTEGFDTADLKDVKALLEVLEEQRL